MRPLAIFFVISSLLGFTYGIYVGNSSGIPFVKTHSEWAIGILQGSSLSDLTPAGTRNPVLTAAHVTDVKADFVADPFMLIDECGYFMFFEVLNSDTDQGDIGLATSIDGIKWKYEQIILDESFHLSYPYVFKWDGEYYMIPESSEDLSIRLYKARAFPWNWEFVGTLLKGNRFVDASIFRFNNMWWLFFSTLENNILFLYFSEILTGQWQEHPRSPVVRGNPNIARPAGRVIVNNGKIIRFAQKDYPNYGIEVNSFEITELSATSYKEDLCAQNPVIQAGGDGWRALGMHHIDLHVVDSEKVIACVDGKNRRTVFGLNH